MSEMSAWARSIGHKIRQCRLARGLTQEQLADGNFSKSYISQLERGTVNPSLRALRLLADRLDVSCAWLLESASSPPALHIKAASAYYFLKEYAAAERMLTQALELRDAFTHRDYVEALLLEARLSARRKAWQSVADACERIQSLHMKSGALPGPHSVSQHYLWGSAWFHRGNRRMAIHHWERGLAALNRCGGPPSHDALLLLRDVSTLYAALGDAPSSRRLATRVAALAAQIASISDMSRWVLARRQEERSSGDPIEISVGLDGDLDDAEAWARANYLLSVAAQIRQDLVPSPKNGVRTNQ